MLRRLHYNSFAGVLSLPLFLAFLVCMSLLLCCFGYVAVMWIVFVTLRYYVYAVMYIRMTVRM